MWTIEKWTAHVEGLKSTQLTLAEQTRRLPHSPGVYMITCTANGQAYIGQSRDVNARVRGHLYSLKRYRGMGENPALRDAVRAYGLRSMAVELVRTCDELALDTEERRAIAELPANVVMNLLPGGRSGYTVPQPLRKIISDNRGQLTQADREYARALVASGSTVSEAAEHLDVTVGAIKTALREGT